MHKTKETLFGLTGHIPTYISNTQKVTPHQHKATDPQTHTHKHTNKKDRTNYNTPHRMQCKHCYILQVW